LIIYIYRAAKLTWKIVTFEIEGGERVEEGAIFKVDMKVYKEDL